METGQLVHQPRVLATQEPISLTPQESTLLRELDLTAANSKTVLGKEIGKEWLRIFADQPEDAITFAFRAWRDESPFFPAISEIRGLIELWKAGKREKEREAKQREDRQKTEVARAKGELIAFPTIKEMVAKASAAVNVPVRNVEEVAKPVYIPPSPEEINRRKQEALESAEKWKKEHGA